MTFKFILNLIVKLKFSNEIWSIKIMSNFSIKQLYVLYKPVASVRVRYKLIHICQKSQRIFLSFDIVMIRIRILPLSQWIYGNRSRDISPVQACALKSRGRFDDEMKNPGHFITRLFLKGRPGNEEAFNSTRNRISSLKVSRPILSTVDWSSGYLLFISYSTICSWLDWEHVYENTKNQGPRFERNNIIAKEQIRDEYGVSYQSSPKIHRMLIARLTMKVYPTRPVCLSIEVILIKLIFFNARSIHLFQSNERFLH